MFVQGFTSDLIGGKTEGILDMQTVILRWCIQIQSLSRRINCIAPKSRVNPN